MKTACYIFHRSDMWYPVELKTVKGTLSANIERNPGTTMVTDAMTQEVLWKLPQHPTFANAKHELNPPNQGQ